MVFQFCDPCSLEKHPLNFTYIIFQFNFVQFLSSHPCNLSSQFLFYKFVVETMLVRPLRWRLVSKVGNGNVKNVICSELSAVWWSRKRMVFSLPLLNSPGDETKGEYLHVYRDKSTARTLRLRRENSIPEIVMAPVELLKQGEKD